MQTTNNASADEFRAAREASGPSDVSLWRVLRGYRADPLRRWTEIREQHGDVATLIGSGESTRSRWEMLAVLLTIVQRAK